MTLNKLKNKIAYLITPEILSLLVLDCILLPLALFTAVWLRLGAQWDPKLNLHIWIFFSVPLWTIPIFINLGLYRAVVKYLDDKVVYVVFSGVAISLLILTFLVHIFNIGALPRTAIIIFGLLALVYIGGSRFLLRGILRNLGRDGNLESVAIYGAGGAGVQLALSLIHSNKYAPQAFIDDDSSKWDSTIRGIKVYSPDALSKLVEKHHIRQVLLAIPSLTTNRRREIIKSLEDKSLYIKTLPGINDVISGTVTFNDLKNIEIEDLLGREPIPAYSELLSKNIEDKVVLITGAGGSIGSELARQIANLNPKQLIILDSSEFALYTINQEIKTKYPYIKLVEILGSVINQVLINDVIKSYKVDTIYHAAAYKHVPIVEFNSIAGIENNGLGTLVVANAAIKYNVQNMVLISTDKAVRPTNIMGASKRLAELVLQAFAKQYNTTNTIFSMVRFGNVLGSSGSVVPLFKQQIKIGGPVTVTHPDIIRYFMTISEAVQLVIQAGSMAVGGEVFVLDMGEPIKIADLAKKMIYLSGLTLKDNLHPDGDIEIKYTGLRPGEKLYEELLIGNNPTATSHDRILMASEPLLEYDELLSKLVLMQNFVTNNDVNAALNLLKILVTDYQPPSI